MIASHQIHDALSMQRQWLVIFVPRLTQVETFLFPGAPGDIAVESIHLTTSGLVN